MLVVGSGIGGLVGVVGKRRSSFFVVLGVATVVGEAFRHGILVFLGFVSLIRILEWEKREPEEARIALGVWG